MKPILIVKLGSTFPALAARQGDFEQWIAQRLGLAREEIRIAGVGQLPARADGFRGVVLTGSHAMVTDRQPWSLAAGEWLRRVVERGMAVLGICYGHQLLADVFGGEAGCCRAGREFGTVQLTLTKAAADDPLFGELPSPLPAQVCHTQSVLKLPDKAVTLARSTMDPCHAFRLGNQAWGVQFHPEFDTHATRFYVKQFRDVLSEEGRDVEAILAGITATPQSESILSRFAKLTMKNS